jgi:hypothetical protein
MSEVEMARIKKKSTNSTSIRYKFGVQVLKDIEISINLDKKNGNR